jgi:hypothetical protein
MPRRYPLELRRQVIELAQSGTRLARLAVTFQMSEVTSGIVIHCNAPAGTPALTSEPRTLRTPERPPFGRRSDDYGEAVGV